MCDARPPTLRVLLLVCSLAVACGQPAVPLPDGGAPDSGVTDAGVIDASDGGLDAGLDGGIDAGPVKPPDAGPAFDLDGGCQVTMCLTGAPSRGSSNTPFDVICDDPSIPGVIQSCEGGSCFNTFNTFGIDAKNSIYPKLFAVLDTNHDSAVNGQDTTCAVNLLGYSWGGVSAVQIATALSTDSRVDPARRQVYRLFVMDPFQRDLLKIATVTVPTNVIRFVEYRHSVTPSGDCSAGAPFGPYKGIRPKCYAGSNCIDYDYSQTSTSQYPDSSGGFYTSSQIGHCEVPRVAAVAVLADFKGLAAPVLPAQVPIVAP